MATTTPVLGLLKPVVGADDDLWGGFLNQNMDVLDAQVVTRGSGVAIVGTSPTSTVYEPLWWDSNSGQLFIQYDDGTSVQWVSANSIDASTLEGSFLPITGGTVTYVEAQTGIFGGIASLAMRDGSHPTWVEEHGMMYYDLWSTMAVYPRPGYQNSVAIAAAVRTSDTPLSPSASAIAFGAYAVSDNSGVNTGPSWGFYGSNRRVPFGNTTFGMELAMGNLGNAIEVNPWQPLGPGTEGVTLGLWLTSGSESVNHGDTVNPAGMALGIGSSGRTWDKGIVFAENGLTKAPTTNTMKAIQLPTKAEMQWIYSTAGQRSAFIRSDANALGGVGILFQNAGLTVVDTATETQRFAVLSGGDAVVASTLHADGVNVNGVPTSASDLVHGLNFLNANTTGINGYGGQLNFSVPTGLGFNFQINASSIGGIDATGMHYIPIGQGSGAAAGSFTTLSTTGATTYGAGVNFGSTLSSSGTDLTRHLALYGNNYGFNVPAANTINVVVAGFTQATFSSVGYVAVAGYLAIGGVSGPTWTTGSAVPSSTQPVGSIYSRVSTWSAGATLYVSKGAGAWTPVAGV